MLGFLGFTVIFVAACALVIWMISQASDVVGGWLVQGDLKRAQKRNKK